MGNIKVSELPTADQIKDEDLLYIGEKDTSSGGYRPRKASIGQVKEAIQVEASTFPPIIEWNLAYFWHFYNNKQYEVLLPFDCYVWGENVGVDGKLQSSGEFTAYRALSLPPVKSSSGLFCPCGTAIGMFNGNSTGGGSIWIAPLKDGNTLSGRVIVKRNQTPAQITQFIEDNIDDNGGKYFATINNKTSGILGKVTGSSDWLKISQSNDTNTYKQFGVCLKTANDHIAFLRFPAGANNYNRLKNGEIPLMLRWGFDHTHDQSDYSYTGTDVRPLSNSSDYSLRQSEFDVLDIIVIKLEQLSFS